MEGDTVVSLLQLPPAEDGEANQHLSLGLFSTDGRFKRLPLDDMQELSGRAATIVKLKEGVSLLSAVICEDGGTVALISDIGRVLCLPVEEHCLPVMGKLAQGPMAMRMLPGETLVGAVSHPPDPTGAGNSGNILVGTENGLLRRVSLKSLRRCKRGDLGEIALELNGNGKDLDPVITVCATTDLVGVITNKTRHARILSDSISVDIDQPTKLSLKTEERLIQLVPLIT